MKPDKERVKARFGEAVRVARKKKHLSQHDVAKEIGISHVHVGYIERGMREPSFYIALRLCDILDIELKNWNETDIKNGFLGLGMVQLGAIVKETRLKKKLLQRDVAQKIGITRNQLSGIERGIYKPSQNILRQLFEILELL